MRVGERVFALTLLLAIGGCGRSSLIGFDDGCPKDDPQCASRDAATDGNRRDGDVFDGFGDAHDGALDGGRDGSIDLGDGSIDLGDLGDGGDGSIDLGDGGRDGGRDGGDGGRDGGCITSEICGNQIDDNCNGLTDCQEQVCQSLPACIDVRKEQCTNGIDDDHNGLIDCADPACFGDPACVVLGREICNNGIDDNDNGLIDCADPECINNLACRPNMGMEICDNGIDDNGDGLVDCSDPQCVTFPRCLTTVCQPEIDFGTLQAHDSRVTRAINTVGATRSFTTCATPGGKARVAQFTLAAQADVRLDFTQVAGVAHVVSVFRAGIGQACDQNLVFCLKAGQAATATHSFPALQPGVYWVIVQSFPGTQGATTVTLSTSPTTHPEICNNGVDDDGNGLTDCADLACVSAPNCQDVQCNPDINLGTLVVDGPGKPATVDTTTSSNRYHPTCTGTSTGNDVTVSFTLPETAGVLVQWNQTGDHAFGLFQFPAPGFKCDQVQQSCYYPGGVNGGSVAFSARAAGKYVFVFKAIGAGKEGVLHIVVSAFKNRMIEICNNNIDDDGNGLIDCDDPACFGIGTCGAPQCLPDIDLGDFAIGTQRMVTVNTQTAQDLYKTTCGKGDGKERVVRLNITQPMALGYSCTQTGSHVLQLAQQLQPLDPCDAHNLNCADPSVLPFGCNFAMPSVQPGRYNVIIEAFQSGQEGSVDLTLFGIQQTVLEICDNGIDDDHDGATDCNDLKCVTSPLCTRFQCRPDQKLNVLPLNGMPTSVVVQTSNAGDDQHSTCTSLPGGQDAVIDFQLPAKADLKIEWAQVGNHAFALYPNNSDLLACDAATVISCTPSMGVSTGSVQLTALPFGKYHLVVDADHPGSEGGVAVQLTGTPSP